MKIKIEKLGMNGEGVARVNGKTVFVNGALPDEQVEIVSTNDFASYEIATEFMIDKTSPNRTAPPCPYFGVCGGCDIQHLEYRKALEFKQCLVKETLEKIAKLNIDVKPTIASGNIYNYRNKASFPVKFFDDAYHVGYYEKKSHKLVEVDKCTICIEEINKAKQIVENWLFELKTPNLVSHLVIRFIDEKLQLVLVVTNFNVPNLKVLADKLNKEFNFSLYLNLDKHDKGEILTPQFKHIAGEKELSLSEMGLNYSVHPYSFMQVNSDVKHKIYNYVLSQIPKNAKVIDAYAGAGLLTAMIAKKAKSAVGIEINKPATESAEELFKANNITNAQMINGKTEDVLPALTNDTDIIVLDPAKRGCDEKALNAICSSKAEKVIYISCSPQSLARDLITLTTCFKIDNVQPFDMFPQTSNVETVVILTRQN